MNIQLAEDKALDYLALEQQDSGGYVSYSSPQKELFTTQFTYQTTFAPALILSSISRSNNPKAQTLCKQITAFLLNKKSKGWSFNYWSGGKEQKERPFPDDLDDTFCALSGLWLHDTSLIDETALAHIVKLLLATENEVGGPYRTWLVPEDSADVWRDVDIAVNANIAYFLSLAVNPLPNLTAFLEQAIQTQNFVSPYYPDEYPVMYFIARAYQGPLQDKLAAFILSKRHSDGSWGTPLHTSLALSSLYFAGQPLPAEAIAYLLKQQQTDGSWPAEAFCIDPKREQKTFYNGAAALTTALAVEAISLYKKQQQIAKPTTAKPKPKLLTQTANRAIRSSKSLDSSIQDILLPTLKHTLEGKNANEIILLPQLFYEDLQNKKKISSNTIADLALANLFGWTAYTMYDDILDGDSDSSVLPAANIAMRQSLTLFEQAIPNSPGFHDHVIQVFNAMDSANAWEVTQSRFKVSSGLIHIGRLPNFLTLDRLAERSLGHTLTPLGILAAQGLEPASPQATALHNALRHYLIARQLNDDAHDWQEDLRLGRITYVVARVLRQLDIKPGEHELSSLLAKAEQQFWHFTVRDVCYKITRHTTLSRKLLQQSGILREQNIIRKLLDDNDASVERTLKTVDQAKQFLHAYNDTD